ncbi:MAG: flagellar hook-length control protein FliK [Smithellaceae bacterium]
MDISAVATGEGKSEVSCTNPLMMLKVLHSDKKAGHEGVLAGGALPEGEAVAADPFLATLKEQMLMLLSSTQTEGGDKPGVISDLVPKWLKVIEGAEEAFPGMVPMAALAALAGEIGEGDAADHAFNKDALNIVKNASMFKNELSSDRKFIADMKAILATSGDEKNPAGQPVKEAGAGETNKSAKVDLSGILSEANSEDALKAGPEGSRLTGKQEQTGVRVAPDLHSGEQIISKVAAKDQAATLQEKTPGLSEPIAKLASDAKTGDASILKATSGEEKAPVGQTTQKMDASTSLDQSQSKQKAASDGVAERLQQAGVREIQPKMPQEKTAKSETLAKENVMQARNAEEVIKSDHRIQEARTFSASVTEMNAAGDKMKSGVRGKTGAFEKVAEAPAPSMSNVSATGNQSKSSISIEPAQIIQRVAAEFRETLAQESGRVRMTLTPPSLGTLDLDVMVRNGKVRVMLFADNREVQRMLSVNIDTLKNSLQGQGMTIDRCDVMMQDRREAFSQGFGSQPFLDDPSGRFGNGKKKNPEADIAGPQPVKISSGGKHLPDTDRISLFA